MLLLLKKLFKKENTYNTFWLAIVKRQQLLADAFQKQSKKFSRKTLSFFLITYCICFGSAFLWIAIIALKENNKVAFIDPRTSSKSIIKRNAPGNKNYLNDKRQYQDTREKDTAITKRKNIP